jgi:hypothetical protein
MEAKYSLYTCCVYIMEAADMYVDRLRAIKNVKVDRSKSINTAPKDFCSPIFQTPQMKNLFYRIQMYYDAHSLAVDTMKRLALGHEPRTMFHHEVAGQIIDTHKFEENTMNTTPYRIDPDAHDDALALVFWDMCVLPRELALSRLGRKVT